MTLSIDPLGQEPSISQLISNDCDTTLDSKSAAVLQFCQSMSSQTWTAYIDGRFVCVWGLIPPSALSNQAYIWMHSTSEIRNHAFVIVRHSQIVLEEMLKRYERIVGDCVIGADDSIRWLRWLGAEFGDPQNGYLPFVIRSKVNG